MANTPERRIPIGHVLHNPHSIPIRFLPGTQKTVRVEMLDELGRKPWLFVDKFSRFAEIRLHAT